MVSKVFVSIALMLSLQALSLMTEVANYVAHSDLVYNAPNYVLLNLTALWWVTAVYVRFSHTGQVCSGDLNSFVSGGEDQAILLEQGTFLRSLIKETTFLFSILLFVALVRPMRQATVLCVRSLKSRLG